MARTKNVDGTTRVSSLVIRCNQSQFAAKEILTYMRIKARLTTVGAVMLAVEDAGKYTLYILRDLYYFRNVNSQLTDKPFTIKWSECPEPVTAKQITEYDRKDIERFLNSDEGLNKGHTLSELEATTNVSLMHCQRFYVDPANTTPRSRPKRIVERNPFLRSATIGEITRELKRRGYEMTYKPLE